MHTQIKILVVAVLAVIFILDSPAQPGHTAGLSLIPGTNQNNELQRSELVAAKTNPYPRGDKPGGGNCTWWAWQRWFDYGVNMEPTKENKYPNAKEWAEGYRGVYEEGEDPREKAILVLQPGRFASSSGHVAFVEVVYPDGSFTVSEESWGQPAEPKVRRSFASTNTFRRANQSFIFIYFPSSTTTSTVSPPSAPNSPRLTETYALSQSQVAIAWTPVSAGDKYNIHRQNTSGNISVILGLTGTTYTDSGLACGTRYVYWVTAENAAGRSPLSNSATVSTYACPNTTLPPPTTPTLTLDVSPSSVPVGTNVRVYVRSSNSSYNIIRVTFGCGNPTQYEISAPEATFTWSTTGCSNGTRQITAQARTADDPGWTKAINASRSITLSVATTTSCTQGRAVDQTFFGEVLEQLGIPRNEMALLALSKWKSYENTNACWNPLATTWRMENSTSFNSVGVQNYSDRASGIRATSNSLGSPNRAHDYRAIRDFLRHETFDRSRVEADLVAWSGSGGYVPSLLNDWQALWQGGGPTLTDDAQFVSEGAPLDNAKVSRNATFTKCWTIRNTGNTTWDGSFRVRKVSGSYGPDTIGVSGTAPNNTARPCGSFKAPGSAGTYRATYQMEGPRGRFGQQFWVQIVVQ